MLNYCEKLTKAKSGQRSWRLNYIDFVSLKVNCNYVNWKVISDCLWCFTQYWSKDNLRGKTYWFYLWRPPKVKGLRWLRGNILHISCFKVWYTARWKLYTCMLHLNFDHTMHFLWDTTIIKCCEVYLTFNCHPRSKVTRQTDNIY